MSNIPTIPPTTQQIAGTLKSVITASQSLLSMDPRHITELRATFLQFYSHPTFQIILGIPTQQPPNPPLPDNQLKAELSEIKSTILTLSKTVKDLQPKVKGAQAPPPPTTTTPKGKPSAQGQGQGHVTTPTFASKAAVSARPSLVLDLGVTKHNKQFSPEIVAVLNEDLAKTEHQNVKLSASRWTSKGNLILTAHHSVTQASFTAATPTIKSLITDHLCRHL